MVRWVLQIENADEAAEWNKALADLLRRLAQVEGETAAAGQVPNERTYNMVADIGRYLAKHEFITERQLAVIADIAKQKNITLPETPRPGGQS